MTQSVIRILVTVPLKDQFPCACAADATLHAKINIKAMRFISLSRNYGFNTFRQCVGNSRLRAAGAKNLLSLSAVELRCNWE
jgi:hypothetical protein